MLFSLESAQSLPSEDLPDDFFELTIEDARRILRDVKKQSRGTENTPLLTAAMRQLEESKKQLRQLNRFKKAIIRIQFADRIVLQGVFAPTDSMVNVMEFVREFLEDGSKKFYLCKYRIYFMSKKLKTVFCRLNSSKTYTRTK